MPAPSASPIALRLTLSFVAVLALLIALSGMTVFRMEQLARSLHRLSEDQLANQELIADVGENAEDAARKLLVLISAERPERVLAYAEIDAANRRLDAAMTVLDTRFAGGPRRAAFLGVAAKLQNYRNQYSRNVDLIEAEDWVSARRMLLERTEVALAELSSARDNLGRSEHDSTLSGIDTLEARLALDRRIVVALCLGGLAVGAALAWLVIRGIVVPLRHAEAVARRLTGGDYASRVQVTSDDEVGRVSAALNSLAVAVADREEALRRLAQTDVLTGLAQRARFVDEGDRLVAAGAAGGAALLCMDIDRLKLINAVLGFDAGDAAIVDAAARIARTVGDQGVVGRLAGGTFAALVRTDARDTPDDWVRRLHGELDRQVSWGGQSLDLSLTIGVAHASARSGPCEILLRHAEQAMFEAKRRKTASQVFVDAIEADRASHLTLLSDLGEAIAGGQLQMFVQPKVGTLDLQPCGVEALVRWEHPQRGWISPAEFIPFAEGTGRIRQITQWMLERAVQTLAEWQRQGRELCIAVNVSTVDLQDRTLGDRVEALLRAAGVAPRWLQLELTETGLMASGPDPIEVLHRLRALGVRLAIDDFGTGQSSLGYLQKLPVHELKIDRSFVDGFAADPRRRRLLRSIVSLGHGMDLTVTAEGVETPAELAALRESGCDLVQGFLIGRPMTVARFDQWRASRSVEPSTAVADNAPAACPE